LTSWSLLFVFIGGGFGSVIRFLISAIIVRNFSPQLPIATLIANITSCLIIATIFRFGNYPTISPSAKAFIIIGFCGGLSTFSTFSLETITLIKNGQVSWAIANIVVTVILCLGILLMISDRIRGDA